jgi:hypothetical protein
MGMMFITLAPTSAILMEEMEEEVVVEVVVVGMGKEELGMGKEERMGEKVGHGILTVFFGRGRVWLLVLFSRLRV